MKRLCILLVLLLIAPAFGADSTEPHLHFHMATHPRWLAADGLPYVLRAYTLDGVGRSDGSIDRQASGPRRDDLPAEDQVVTF